MLFAMTKLENQSKVILLAEDDDDHFLLIQNAFKAVQKDEVLFREVNGVELMNYLLKKGKYEGKNDLPRPLMIILDLNLPKKDGREVLKEIKSDEQFKDIPVAILTTSINEEDKINSHNLGAKFFIRKPILYKEYVEIMKTLKECWSAG